MDRSIIRHYPRLIPLHHIVIMEVGQGELLACPIPRIRIANSVEFGA